MTDRNQIRTRSEYWKSNAKKYCDYCKVWIADNKASINIHESGNKHKDKVKEKLKDIKKRTNENKVEEAKTAKIMASIDRSAMDAMKKDLSSNPRLRHQYGYEATAAAVADEDEPVVKKIAPKTTKTKSPKTVTTTKSAVKRKIEEPEVKIGKWQTVVEKKPVIVNTGFIDLQLPGSSSTASNKYESQVELEFQTEPIKKEEESGPPKPKWNPIGFQSIEQEDCEPKTVESTHNKEEIKQETELEPEPEQTLYYTEPTAEKVIIPEKVVTLEGLFKSSKKPVSFKKRKTDSANQNLRERKDD